MGVAALTPGPVPKLDVLVVNAGSTSLKLSRCSGDELIARYSSLEEALEQVPGPRLVAGSLYLAGQVLAANDELPD